MADRTVKVSLVASVNNFVSGLNQAQRAAQKSGDAAQEAARKYEEQSRTMTAAGKGLMAAGAVALAATGLAVKAAIDWESAWAGVTKTVDGTPEQMSELEDSLRSLARSLPATHTEIAAVAEAAGQLGVKRADVAAFTKTMIDLSETTNLTADEAATSIAQLMNVMQTAPGDVDNLGAALVALGNDGASTERDIIQMAQRIAGAGRVVGLTEAQVLAFANALASVGIEAEAGGSAISRVMTDIAMAVSAGGDDLESFAKVAGMSSADFSKAFKETPAEAITSFIEGLGRIKASGGDVFKTLSDLGQSDIRVSQALLGMANSGDLLRESLELGSKAWEENTALSEEAAKRYETTEAKLQIAGNAAKDAAISFGSVFLPAVSAVAEAIAGLAAGFSGLPEGMQATVAILAVVAGAAALAGGAFLFAVPKIAQFSAALAIMRASELPGVALAAGAVTSSIGRVSGALGKAAAFLTGPWGLAIAAAGLGIAELTRLMESMQATTEEMTNAAATAQSAEQILSKAFQGIATGFVWEEGATAIANFNENLQKIGQYRENIFMFPGLEGGSLMQALKNVNDVLGPMAKTDLPGAARAFELLAEETDGSEKALATLLNELPDYRDALTEIATEQGINVSAMSEAEKAQALLKIATDASKKATEGGTDALTAAAEATEAAKAANEEYLAGLAAGDAAFIGFGDALSAAQQKQQDWAEQTAQDTEDSSDSWQDYYDGFSVNLEDYLAELQRQIDAQSAWEQNMILLAGRASDGVLSELAAMGPEGAPLVAQLVNATDEQLAVMEQAFGERSEAGTQSFTDALVSASPVIAAAAAQLGQGAAAEIAAKLASGKVTVEQIMQEYKLKVENTTPRFSVDTTHARETINNLFTTFDGKTINIPVRGSAEWTGPGRAAGGWIPGAPSHRDNVLVPMATGEFVTRTREAQKPANRPWLEYMNAGGQMPPFGGGGFANGGYVQPQYASSSPHVMRAAPVIKVDVHAAPGMDETALTNKIVRKIEGLIQ